MTLCVYESNNSNIIATVISRTNTTPVITEIVLVLCVLCTVLGFRRTVYISGHPQHQLGAYIYPVLLLNDSPYVLEINAEKLWGYKLNFIKLVYIYRVTARDYSDVVVVLMTILWW